MKGENFTAALCWMHIVFSDSLSPPFSIISLLYCTMMWLMMWLTNFCYIVFLFSLQIQYQFVCASILQSYEGT